MNSFHQIGSKKHNRRQIGLVKSIQLWLFWPERKINKSKRKGTNSTMAILLKRKIHQPTKEGKKAPNTHLRIVPSTARSINRSRVLQQRIRKKPARQKLNCYKKKIEICIYGVVDL